MTLPLFERHPALSSLPLAGISKLPTPVESLELPLDADFEQVWPMHGLWVKRDDLTSPRYGGNKVRKLDFLLGCALAEQRRAVITFGAYGSNHALATAVHGTALGLEVHVVLSPQAPGPFAARTLRAHAGIGTHLHPVDGWDGLREAVRVRRELAERDGVEPMVIPMGGTNALGALGYVNAALEVVGQARTVPLGPVELQAGSLVRPDVVYVAGGTLGTAVGLAVGFALAGGPWRSTRVEAVRVTPAEIANPSVAEELAASTVGLLRSLDPGIGDISHADLNLVLREEFFEPGYGVVTPETTAAVNLAREGGLGLETTYTGKAFSAMLADASAGRLAEEHVLFWDTYSSAPYPEPGPDEALPEPLRDYVAECDRLFGAAG